MNIPPRRYGGREGFQDASQLWTTVGLRGEIFDNYNWDASTTYSRTSSMTGTRNTVRRPSASVRSKGTPLRSQS